MTKKLLQGAGGRLASPRRDRAFEKFKPRRRKPGPRPAFEGDESGRCGGCGSRRLVTERLREDSALHGVCQDCGRFQEVETRDWPLSKMCDNCAFRVGSPERADPYRWAEIEATIAEGRPFHCHKGLELDPDSGRFSPPDPARSPPQQCAGWLAAYIATFKRPAP